jgi:hypothetical protein
MIAANDRVRILNNRTYQPETGGQYAGVGQVVKVNQTTATVRINGRTVRCPLPLLTATTDPLPDPADTRPRPEPAAVVTVDTSRVGLGPKWAYPDGQLFVVLADKGTHLNVAKLGGDGGRYWRLPADTLTLVDPATVTAS